MTALRAWAHSLGLELRSGLRLRTNAIASAALLDIPEGKSLGFKNLDDYRCLAGGRDMAGHAVLSCEERAPTPAARTTPPGRSSCAPWAAPMRQGSTDGSPRLLLAELPA